jgi:hypothetical protein
VRAESNRQSAEALVGSGPIVPVARSKFVALLDKLALAAELGALPSGCASSDGEAVPSDPRQ